MLGPKGPMLGVVCSFWKGDSRVDRLRVFPDGNLSISRTASAKKVHDILLSPDQDTCIVALGYSPNTELSSG